MRQTGACVIDTALPAEFDQGLGYPLTHDSTNTPEGVEVSGPGLFGHRGCCPSNGRGSRSVHHCRSGVAHHRRPGAAQLSKRLCHGGGWWHRRQPISTTLRRPCRLHLAQVPDRLTKRSRFRRPGRWRVAGVLGLAIAALARHHPAAVTLLPHLHLVTGRQWLRNDRHALKSARSHAGRSAVKEGGRIGQRHASQRWTLAQMRPPPSSVRCVRDVVRPLRRPSGRRRSSVRPGRPAMRPPAGPIASTLPGGGLGAPAVQLSRPPSAGPFLSPLETQASARNRRRRVLSGFSLFPHWSRAPARGHVRRLARLHECSQGPSEARAQRALYGNESSGPASDSETRRKAGRSCL